MGRATAAEIIEHYEAAQKRISLRLERKAKETSHRNFANIINKANLPLTKPSS